MLLSLPHVHAHVHTPLPPVLGVATSQPPPPHSPSSYLFHLLPPALPSSIHLLAVAMAADWKDHSVTSVLFHSIFARTQNESQHGKKHKEGLAKGVRN